jgi:competence ComEA-like helix-hairpin-helix protein
MKQLLKILASFSTSERIGLAVLIGLLTGLIWIPHLMPLREREPMDVAAFKHKIDSLSQFVRSENTVSLPSLSDYRRNDNDRSYEKKKAVYTPFDPNTADTLLFEQLGFSPKQAAAIINYRAHGAVFRTPDDFKKVFVVSPEHFEQLQSYIHIDTAALPKRPHYDTTRFQRRERPIIEINAADTAALQLVNGIGAITANRIVAYRKRLGGYASIEQLREISGMTDERFEQIALQITVNTDLYTRINLQTADETVLKTHPYIGAYAARGIVHFRQVAGAASCTVDALIQNNILKKETAEKLRPYVVDE